MVETYWTILQAHRWIVWRSVEALDLPGKDLRVNLVMGQRGIKPKTAPLEASRQLVEALRAETIEAVSEGKALPGSRWSALTLSWHDEGVRVDVEPVPSHEGGRAPDRAIIPINPKIPSAAVMDIWRGIEALTDLTAAARVVRGHDDSTGPVVGPRSLEYLGVIEAASVYAWGTMNPDRTAARGERVALGRRLRELRRRVISEGAPLKDRRRALFAYADADHKIAAARAALDRARVAIAEGTLASVLKLQKATRGGLIEISGLAPGTHTREIIPALQWQDLEIDPLGEGGAACVRRPGIAEPPWRALLVECLSVIKLAGLDRQPWLVALMARREAEGRQNFRPAPPGGWKPVTSIGSTLNPTRYRPEPPAAPDSAEPVAAAVDQVSAPAGPAAKVPLSRSTLTEWVRATVAENQHRPRYSARTMEKDARARFPNHTITRKWIEEAHAAHAPARWHDVGAVPRTE